MLRVLSGAEDAMAVNNNAAAVYLMLKGLTINQQEGILPEVIVSRGELVEIGGSFRVPDIMREAGVKMVEVKLGKLVFQNIPEWYRSHEDRSQVFLRVQNQKLYRQDSYQPGYFLLLDLCAHISYWTGISFHWRFLSAF